MRRRRIARTIAATAAALGVVAAAGAADASAAGWQEVQLPPPAGGQFASRLGPVGDLQFWAPNRGLALIAGNTSVPAGLFSWDGQGWHQLATVCGASAAGGKLAWAGPTEFWTVTDPSLPRGGARRALCRFKDGTVAGSFSTPLESPDPFGELAAAACRSASDCLFGGPELTDPSGGRRGAFHLRWDGTALRTAYAPQGRAVSDLEPYGDGYLESVLAGARDESPAAPALAQSEPGGPRLLHQVVGETFANDPFLPAPRTGVPADGTELTALDADGPRVWAVGGGARSGPTYVSGSEGVDRPPIALLHENGAARELPLDTSALPYPSRFVDVAAVPGTGTAWAAVRRTRGDSPTERATLARIAADGTVQVVTVPDAGQPARGEATNVACPAPDDCWMTTTRGWVFRWTDGASFPVYERDADPAFQGTITERPNEAAAQFVPDAPPEDDSLKYAPPPLELPPALREEATTPVDAEPAVPERRTALLRDVKARLIRGTLTYEVRFRLTRRARVGLVARRGRKVVARARTRTLKPGRHRLRVKLQRKRWPTKISVATRELEATR